MPEQPELQSTPVKYTNSRAATFTSSSKDPKAPQYRLDIAQDMRMEFVGPMPVDEFLEAFVPSHSEPAPQVGDALGTIGSSENEFINAVESHGLCPSLELVNTTANGDPDHPKYCKPDMSVYNRKDTASVGPSKTLPDEAKQSDVVSPPANDVSPPASDVAPPPPTPQPPKANRGSRKADRARHNKLMSFPILELPIERKPDSLTNDPFIDSDPADVNKKTSLFQRDDALAKENRGQMISYVTAMFSAQFRSFAFSIFLFPEHYRLIRWDRAGAIVTRRLSLGSDGQYLAEFLWRFNHMTPQQRGRDPTVCVPKKEEADLARTLLESKDVREYMVDMNGQIDLPFTTLHKFHVRDEKTQKDHYFVAPSPRWYTYAPTGRCTFGYIAYDLQKRVLVYLKDTWRADAPDIKPEGVTYRDLHEHSVPYIAGLVCSGDVGDQKTRTREFTQKPWVTGEVRVGLYIHYRLVLDTIGRPLKSSKSSLEICTSVRHAVESHWVAYDKARVLHRDVSGGNILVRKNKKGDGYEGLLIDWELCKSVDLKSPRRDWRTGTWQFIAAQILMQPSTPHELRHDLESFFHVLFYHVLRYCRNSIPKLEGNLYTVFDSGDWDEELKTITGGDQKRSLFFNGTFPAKQLFNQFKAPLAELIYDLRKSFKRLYIDDDDDDFSPEALAASLVFLSNSEGFMAIFDKHLKESDWAEDDAGRDNLAGNAKKRSQEGSNMMESFANSRGKRVRSLQQAPGDAEPMGSVSFHASLAGVAEEKEVTGAISPIVAGPAASTK